MYYQGGLDFTLRQLCRQRDALAISLRQSHWWRCRAKSNFLYTDDVDFLAAVFAANSKIESYYPTSALHSMGGKPSSCHHFVTVLY